MSDISYVNNVLQFIYLLFVFFLYLEFTRDREKQTGKVFRLGDGFFIIIWPYNLSNKSGNFLHDESIICCMLT